MMRSYEDIRNELRTGDIVLFSGEKAISSLIKLFSGGNWSHVGMVLRIKAFGDAVLIWESTTLNNVPDIEAGLQVKGVQLVAMSQRIRWYDGGVSVRHLRPEITDEMYAKLAKARHELARKPYEQDEIELLKSAWDSAGGNNRTEDLSSLFCSELVAEAYQAMGLLKDVSKGGLPSNEYTPVDFSEKRNLSLMLGYSLGREISIKK